MTASLVAVGAGVRSTGNTTISTGAFNRAIGDLLVCVINVDSSSGAAVTSVLDPENAYQKLGHVDDGVNRIEVWYVLSAMSATTRQATVNVSPSSPITASAASFHTDAGAWTVRADAGGVFQNSAAGTSSHIAGDDTVDDNAVLIAGFAMGDGSGSAPVVDADFTSIYTNGGSSAWAGTYLSEYRVISAAETAEVTATHTSQANRVGILGVFGDGQNFDGQLVAIGLAAETDTAHAATPTKALTPGIAQETDSALALVGASIVPIGLATETDTAFGADGLSTVPIGLATETDTAFSAGKAKAKDGEPAEEINSANAVLAVDALVLSQATETDSAFGVEPLKRRAVGIAAESDQVLQARIVKAVGIGLAIETDIAFNAANLPFPIGQAQETDTALPAQPLRVAFIGLAESTNTAFAVGVLQTLALIRAVPTWKFTVDRPVSLDMAAFFGGDTTGFTLTAGTLPTGLSLDPVSGFITGTPTNLGSSAGIVIQATDGVDDVPTNSFTIQIVPAVVETVVKKISPLHSRR